MSELRGRLTQEELGEVVLLTEASLRVALSQACIQATDDVPQRDAIAGSVAALLLRRYVEAADNPHDYLEKVMRMILTP